MRKETIESVTDGITNVLTGMGVKGKDPTLSSTYSVLNLDKSEIDQAYAASKIIERIVDRPAEDMTREGFKLNFEDSEKKEIGDEFFEFIKQINFYKKLDDAIRYQRLYGFGGIVFGGQSDLSKELGKNEEIKYCFNIHRYNLAEPTPTNDEDIEFNFMDNNFGNLKCYRIVNLDSRTGVNYKIHHSRVLPFHGFRHAANSYGDLYFGTSIVNKIFQSVKSYEEILAYIPQYMRNAARVVFKMKELNQILARGEDGDKVLRKRFELLTQSSSILQAIVLQDGEEISSYNSTSSITPSTIEFFNIEEKKMVADSEMPHTVLLGEGAGSGMNNKGESETRNWYDWIKNKQEKIMRGPLEKFASHFFASKNIKDKFNLEFNPLWQMSEREEAEIREIMARADVANVNAGILLPTEVSNSRFGGTEFSLETYLDKEQRESMDLSDDDLDMGDDDEFDSKEQKEKQKK